MLPYSFPTLAHLEFDLAKNIRNRLGKIMNPVYAMEEILKTIFSSYTYLGPLREQPQRRYIYDDEVLEIGTKGDNAPYIYLAERDNILKDHYFYDPTTDSFKKKEHIRLSDAVKRG